MKDKIYTLKELKQLNRSEQFDILKSRNIIPSKKAKEDELIRAILDSNPSAKKAEEKLKVEEKPKIEEPIVIKIIDPIPVKEEKVSPVLETILPPNIGLLAVQEELFRRDFPKMKASDLKLVGSSQDGDDFLHIPSGKKITLPKR